MTSPNILFISIDSLRADFCSVIDSSLATTPFLNTLATDSAVYYNAISPSTWTLPVHASIFTGLYPQEHQLNDEGHELGDHPTFAELLTDHGYATKSFGHNGWLEQGDILRGFDHVHTPAYGPKRGGFRPIRSRWQRLKEETFRLESEDRFTIDRVKESLSEEDEPFCYFVHLQGVHYTYQPHIRSYKRFGNLTTHGLYRNLQKQRELYDSRLNKYLNLHSVPEDDIIHFKDLYRGCIYEADQLVAELGKKLQNLGIFDDTILVVAGDHGDMFGENGIFGHNFTVSDGVIRVPLLVRDPTNPLKSGAHTEIVQLNDLYPTLLEAAECDFPKTNSRSLYSDSTRDSAFVSYSAPESMWRDISENAPPELGAELDNYLEREQRLLWKDSDRKLVWYPVSEQYESTGSAADELQAELSAHTASLQTVEPEGAQQMTDEVLENLENMGYL